MKLSVEIELPHEPEGFAELLNTMASYLEGNEAPPDHWDDAKRAGFYSRLRVMLDKRTVDMCHKLSL